MPRNQRRRCVLSANGRPTPEWSLNLPPASEPRQMYEFKSNGQSVFWILIVSHSFRDGIIVEILFYSSGLKIGIFIAWEESESFLN